MKRFLATLLTSLVVAAPVAAQSDDTMIAAETPTLETSYDAGAAPRILSDSSLLVFGGRSIEGHVWQPDSLPFVADYGGQFQIGAALARTPFDLPFGFVFGGETGATLRFDGDRFGRSGVSGEFWLGPTIRHSGIPIGPVLFRPAFTFGYTAVTGSNGLERRREIEEDGDATFLYFMAPELAFSLKSHPNIDFVYRAQHRSGGKNIFFLPSLGDLGDTANANVFGVRWHF